MKRWLGVSERPSRVAPAPAPAPELLPMRARQSLFSEPGLGVGPRLPASRVTVRAGAPPASPAGPFVFTATLGSRNVGQVQVDLTGRSEIAIHDLAVAPAFRGAGFGALLMTAALRFGARAGRSRARLEADDDGSGRLVRWYRGLGFTAIGTSPRGLPTMQADLRRALSAEGRI